MSAKYWQINTSNHNLTSFDRQIESTWKESYFFIQGADSQFGLISEFNKDPIYNWEKEKELSEDLVRRVNLMQPKPKFFIICGDLCDAFPIKEQKDRDAQREDFKRIFGKVDSSIPLVCVCGNHDVGDTPTQQTVEMYRSDFGDDYFSFLVGGVLFLVLNSQYFYDSSQVEEIAKEHTKWIDECLEQARTQNVKRIVIFQHIPWFLSSIDEPMDEYFNLNPTIRKLWLDKFKAAGVVAIFCGHYHRNAGGSYNGIDVVVTSAIGAQIGDDVSGVRVVKVLENKIEHQYYGISELPENITF